MDGVDQQPLYVRAVMDVEMEVMKKTVAYVVSDAKKFI
jgi:hypothetical protein